MRHRFTPRTSVEKSDWHTWSPAPLVAFSSKAEGFYTVPSPQGGQREGSRTVPSPQGGEGQGEGKNVPATARQAPRAWAWRPDTFRWSCERSGEIRGVEDRSNRGSRVGVEVNGERRDHRVAGFKSDKRWNDTTRCSTHPVRTLGGHILAHHSSHLGMSHHTERASANDCCQCYGSNSHEKGGLRFAQSPHLEVPFEGWKL